MRTTVVGAGLLVAVAVFAAVAMGAVVADDGGDADGEANASFGAEVSSFMQANAAEAEGEVDDGMFGAAMNRTDDPEERRQLIEQRQQRLEERQQRLEERRNRISNDGDVSDRALATGVTVGADRLERSANGTERAAEAAGLDTERLNEIRRNASELAGPDVSDLARGMADAPRGPGGPGGEMSGNVTDSPDDRNAGPPDDRNAGPPDDRTDRDDAGPPGGDRGTGDSGADDNDSDGDDDEQEAADGADGDDGEDSGKAGDGADGSTE